MWSAVRHTLDGCPYSARKVLSAKVLNEPRSPLSCTPPATSEAGRRLRVFQLVIYRRVVYILVEFARQPPRRALRVSPAGSPSERRGPQCRRTNTLARRRGPRGAGRDASLLRRGSRRREGLDPRPAPQSEAGGGAVARTRSSRLRSHPLEEAGSVGGVAGSLGLRGAKTWRPRRGRGSLKNDGVAL